MKIFQFTDDPSALSDGDTLVAGVPPGLADKEALLAWYSESLSFPQYFGRNWDALDDCLRDLAWIKEHGVLIIHSDVPLEGSRTEQKIYLDILARAVREWKIDGSRRFTVAFPREFQRVLLRSSRPNRGGGLS